MDLKTIIVDNDRDNTDDLLWNLNFCGGFSVAAQVTCFEELAELPKEQEYDVAFISMTLPTSDGFYCGYYLQRNFPDIKIVMMADEKQYAFEAYDNGYFDYIMKPLDPGRIEKTINRLKASMPYEEAIIDSPQRIMVKQKGGYQMIDVSNVLFIEMRNRRCCMILSDQTVISLQRYTMDSLEKMFSPLGFYRCYQSVIVHVSKVAQVVADAQERYCYATLYNYNQKIPVSREKFASLVAMLEDSSSITISGRKESQETLRG